MTSALMIDGDHVASVPRDIALCPECGSELFVEASVWDAETGVPLAHGLTVFCDDDEREMWEAVRLDDMTVVEHPHQWRQCDWQPARDAVTKWVEAETNGANDAQN